jgi:hypothetical protein
LAVTAETATAAVVSFKKAWSLAFNSFVGVQLSGEIGSGGDTGGEIELLVALSGEICSFYLQQLSSGANVSKQLDQFIKELHATPAAPSVVLRSDNVLFAMAVRALAKKVRCSLFNGTLSSRVM